MTMMKISFALGSLLIASSLTYVSGAETLRGGYQQGFGAAVRRFGNGGLIDKYWTMADQGGGDGNRCDLESAELIKDLKYCNKIYEIQGDELTSPFHLQEVYDVPGIITAVNPTKVSDWISEGGGYFIMQDPFGGDGDDSTSDAIAVFPTKLNKFEVGDIVQVTGVVQKLKAFNDYPFDTEADYGGQFQTSIASSDYRKVDVEILSRGNALPEPVIIGKNGRQPPTETMEEGIKFYESLEWMYVTVETPLVVEPTGVSPTYSPSEEELAQIFIVTDDGRNATGFSERGTLNISPDDFNPERLKIDKYQWPGIFDSVFPDVSVGAKLTDVTGILTYSNGYYEIKPTKYFGVDQRSTLEPTVATCKKDVNTMLIGTYNLDGLYVPAPTPAPSVVPSPAPSTSGAPTTSAAPTGPTYPPVAPYYWPSPTYSSPVAAPSSTVMPTAPQPARRLQDNPDSGNDPDPGGPPPAYSSPVSSPVSSPQNPPPTLSAEAKIEAIAKQIAINMAGPDVVALQEVLHDCSGCGKDADFTLTALVNAISEIDENLKYEYVTNDLSIYNDDAEGDVRAFLYNPWRVSFLDETPTDIQVNSTFYRLPLAATFKFLPLQTKFEIINVHFTNKLFSSASAGVYQPYEELQEVDWINEGLIERNIEAYFVREYIGNLTDPPIVLGTMNEFEWVSPLLNLEGAPKYPMRNLVYDIDEDERYSNIYQGNSRALDHILVSDPFCPGAEPEFVRVNVEFANQASDHDPMVACIDLQYDW